MRRLPPTQQTLLEEADRDRDGDVHVYVPRFRTAEALARKGLLKHQGHSWKFAATRFTITDAGRAALAAPSTRADNQTQTKD